MRHFHCNFFNLLLFVFILTFSRISAAQNINGEKVIVGRESITVINFPDRVLNINFSDDAAYDYYIPKRREEKSISVQFNKEKKSAPNTGLLVNEGGRSHMFRLTFDSTYNINDDSRPPLWYDHSNLKQLKVFVQKQKDVTNSQQAEAEETARKQQEKEEAEARQQQAIAEQKKKDADAANKAKEMEQQRKLDEDQQRKRETELAKAKKDADEKEKQSKLAAQKEAEAKRLAQEKAKKDADELAKQKAEQEQKLKALKEKQAAEALAKDQQIKELKAKKDADALAKAQKEKELKEQQAAEALVKAQKDAEEKQRVQEEKIAKQKALEEEKRKKAEEELARKEAERIAAQERFTRLEEERKQKELEKAYSQIGLWQRYGKKGFDLYNMPRGQMATVNTDFYIAKDTAYNFAISDSLLKVDNPVKLNIEANDVLNKGVKIVLENIDFKDVHTYYKLRIENNTDEDFLMGKTYMYWYDAKEQPKMIVKSSYLTYASFFPLVRPKSVQYVIFVTRSPNVVNDESLVLFIEERRKEKGSTSIVISGADYNKELAKIQADVKRDGQINDAEPSSSGKKKGKRKK